MNIAVPEEFSILGVDDDPLLCRANRPTLSAVDQGCHRVGYRAAEVLAAWFDGEQPPSKPILVEPAGVRQRTSTSYYVTEDPLVSRAMSFIRKNACKGIQVPEVCDYLNCSRRMLEIQFGKCVGRTVHEEIVRVRVDHARTLLHETRLSIADVAERCGYRWQAQLTRVFKAQVGQTPIAYRQRIRSGS